MATPTYASKRYYAAAAKVGSTWGTAVAVGATDGLIVTDDGGLGLKKTYSPYPAVDQIVLMDGDMGPSDAVDFNPPFTLSYEPGRMGSIIAALFGTAGAPAQQGATTAYKHIFQWADSVSKFFTVAMEKPGKVWEVPSAMPYKLNLKLGDGKVQGVISLRGNTLTEDSATNGATQLDAVTYAERGKRVQFQNGYFWTNAQSGSGLSASDAIVVSDLDLTYERFIDAQQVAGGAYIAVPTEGKAPAITLKVTIPRATAALIDLSNFNDMTAQKMEIGFTSPALAGVGYYYSWKLLFPRLKLVEPPSAAYEDVIKTVLTFTAEEAAAAPTGMSYTRPYAELVCQQTTDFLA